MRISIIIATIIAKIEALEDTDTSARPENCVNLYLTNYLARKENTKAVEQLNSEEFLSGLKIHQKMWKQVIET